MRKQIFNTGLVIGLLLLIASNFTFGQQLLWSTEEKDSLKELNQYVHIKNATEKVLELYDAYDLYYDFTGFSKDASFDFLGSEEKKKINEISGLMVLAARANLGKGSFVVVYCISKQNINTIIFSNTHFVSGMPYMSTYTYEREKFAKWFKTLLN